jgi:hypothetical protein
LIKLFGGRNVASREGARQVFLRCENDPRALCFAGVLKESEDEIRRAAELGDAFASVDEEGFQWAKKSAAQGERNGFCELGLCYGVGSECEKDAKRAKENYLVAVELGDVCGLVSLGRLFDIDDPQRFVWLGRAAAANGDSYSFLKELSVQVFTHAKVVFAIGRALKGHINNEKRTIFGIVNKFDARIGPANQALHFYEFQLQSYRKAVDSWTIVGLRNRVVKEIRKMIGNMI